MDAYSYVSGFIQGLIACEMLVLIVKIIIQMLESKNDMKQIDLISTNIEQELEFSKIICDKLKEQDDRISKLENTEQKEENSNE